MGKTYTEDRFRIDSDEFPDDYAFVNDLSVRFDFHTTEDDEECEEKFKEECSRYRVGEVIANIQRAPLSLSSRRQ